MIKSLFIGPLKTDLAEVNVSSVALDIESAIAIIEFFYTGEIYIDDGNLEAILKMS